MSYRHPFRGLRVLDVSQGFAGPYVGGLMALYGAAVTKVEPPEGDWIRRIGTVFGEQTSFSVVANRGKRSIALDLKSEDGRTIAHRLVSDADLFIESFRPGVAARLGIDYATVRAINPRIIYLSVSGFGQNGPAAMRPATDTVIQAHSGFMSINRGLDGIPHRAGTLVPDTAAGLYAFQAVAAALYARATEAEGCYLDVSLMQSTAAFIAPKIVEYHATGGHLPVFNVPSGSYRTADGWLAITQVKEEHFDRLCRALGLDALAADPRFNSFEARVENVDVLRGIVSETLATRSTEEWVKRFAAADALCNPINDFGDWLADPQVRVLDAAPMTEQPDIGAVPVVTVPGTVPADDPADAPKTPRIGEHGRTILGELGYDAAAIDALARNGVVRLSDKDD